MSNSNSSNSTAVPEAKSALNRFKYEVASELGVPLTDGYNGNLTSKQNGSVKRNKIKKGDASLLKKLPSYFAFYSLINRFSFLLLHIRRLQHNKQQILLV